jgi:RHS repeat-associated protein
VENRFNPTISELEAGTVTRTYYDRMPALDTLGVELYSADLDTAEAFKYNRGRVVATISDVYIPKSPDGTPLQTTDGVDSVTRASTANIYDKRGRVIESYIYNGSVTADSLKMVATATEYDLAGKILQVTKYPYGLSDAGKSRKVVERYSYDRLGRVDTLYVKNGSSPETVLAAYEYYPTGSVKSIKMGNTITLDYEYHISGTVKSAVAYVLDGSVNGASSVPKVLYSETLYYEDCDSDGCTPQYNGNISRMVHKLAHINQFFSTERDVAYYYDELNRLTKVDDKDERAFYDEAFTYDPQGRIVRQARAEIAHEANGGASYVYIPNTNKLLTVSSNGGGKLNDRFIGNSYEIFRYDRDGNMVEDKSKQMTISYDHRGLPVEFKREVFSNENGADSVRLVLNYDGAGSRISKIRERKSAGETAWTMELATHYTGIGSEIREDAVNNDTKVVVNLPQSLGRYDIASAIENAANSVPGFEWYLKNHLGSTMLVYGINGNDGSLKAAYDYRAFGEQVDLTHTTDKVTETFTGKEKDDETELSYFGARYLDQMLGMWVSVDAKRQHYSPYEYGSNSPINVFDPDGNADLRLAIYYNARGNGQTQTNIPFDANSYVPVMYKHISDRIDPSKDQVNVKAFGEGEFMEMQIWLNKGDLRAIMTHGVPSGDYITDIPYTTAEKQGNHRIEFGTLNRFLEPTFIGACYSKENIDTQEYPNLIPSNNSGVIDADREAANYLIENSDTKKGN